MVGFAATEDSRVMNVPTRKIGPGPAAGVFVLDPQGSIRPAQLASVQIEHSARLASELGIAGEDPTTVIPGRDGVFLQAASRLHVNGVSTRTFSVEFAREP